MELGQWKGRFWAQEQLHKQYFAKSGEVRRGGGGYFTLLVLDERVFTSVDSGTSSPALHLSRLAVHGSGMLVRWACNGGGHAMGHISGLALRVSPLADAFCVPDLWRMVRVKATNQIVATNLAHFQFAIF